MKILLIMLITFLSVACSDSITPREKQDWLSHTEAKIRHANISNLTYQLYMDLNLESEFSGISELTFDSTELKQDLTIDFSGGAVQEIKINDEIAKYDYNDFFISLDKSLIKSGKNVIQITFTHPYSDNGSGLYRYTDKEDGKTYIYSHFEPYSANRMFPNFDQPNLRATFDLTVKVPKEWLVISSAMEKTVEQKETANLWTFNTSLNHSTYILPLHAGEYTVWKDDFNGLPLRLFARQSLAKYVNEAWWFDTTKKGLAFFNEYFDYDYPFGKYDQLIVPDFNIGGMENVGAVTYTETIVSRGETTASRKERIAGLLLHEMSHMWFGDLITVDWWSGLWLKESFATYMANLALEKTGISPTAWNLFYTRTKQSAYRADERVTTHAIQMPVTDTKSGSASYDSITYSKGASVLSQLTHYLGADIFKKGVQIYFKKFDYQATTLPDFIDTLGDVAQQDLSVWTNDWIYSPGVNRIQVDFQCDAEKITHFTIRQAAPEGLPTIRSHSLKVGLYAFDETDKKLSILKVQPIIFTGKNTVVKELEGEACPDLVYPNHGDWGYVKVLLDKQTLKNIPKSIPYIEDPMLKAMFYQSLWDLVQDKKIPLTKFVNLAMVDLSNEKDINVLSLVLYKLSKSRHYFNKFPNELLAIKQAYLDILESFYWKSVAQQAAGSDAQRTWVNSLPAMVQSEKGLNRLIALLNGKESIDGFKIDQDYRWKLMIQLSAMGHKGAANLVAVESKNDSSHKAKLAAIEAGASMPNKTAKERWFIEFEKEENRLSASLQKEAMYGMFLSHQSRLYETFAQRAIDDLIKFDQDRDQGVIQTMVYNMMPTMCNANSVARLGDVIKANPQLGLSAMKGLKEVQQEDQRCVDLSTVLMELN